MNWKDIPLPDKMKNLETYRGFPVPYVILKDNSGVYQFKINDEVKRQKCIDIGLCAICGKLLGRDTWLIGGPLSAFHDHGAFVDTPGHYECYVYALQVCPYLAMRSYTPVLIDTDKVDMPESTVFVDPTVIIDRPEVFALIHITGFRIQDNGRLMSSYLIPRRPYLAIELWDQGLRVPLDEIEFSRPLEDFLV